MHHASMCSQAVWSLPTFSKHQWISLGAIFFCRVKIHDTLLLQTHFHGRCHCVKQPVCCPLCHGNKMISYWWEGSISTATSPASASFAVGQHIKVGSIIFRTAFIETASITVRKANINRSLDKVHMLSFRHLVLMVKDVSDNAFSNLNMIWGN